MPLGRAHDAVPEGRRSSCARRAPATCSCSAAGSSPRTTSRSSRTRASRRSSRPGASTGEIVDLARRAARGRAGELTRRGPLRAPGQGPVRRARDPGPARDRRDDRRRRPPRRPTELGGRVGREGPGADRRPRQGRWRRARRLAGARRRRRPSGCSATGFKGMPVTRVLVEELLPIASEFYTSILLDRSVGRYLAMMTAEGGVDIEELARTRPEAIRRLHVDPILGLRDVPGPPARRRRSRRTRARAPRRSSAKLFEVAHRRGRDARRGEPARAARGRPRRGARREGHGRRQRAVPPPDDRGARSAVPDRSRRGAREGEGARST